MKRVLWVLAPTLLLGCADDDFSDLKNFMAEAGKGSVAKIEPLPPVKPLDSFVYQAEQLVDPFNVGPLKGGQQDQAKLGQAAGPATVTDYPLDALRVVGALEKKGIMHALIATPENRLHLVKSGDRIGNSSAVVIAVHGKGIEVRQRVMNSAGKWVDVTTSLQKQQSPDVQSGAGTR